ncbi:MAG: hypothetical protein QOJ26_712 [Thermoplasmata archaeon]|jgi:hypothetical protein|nr:hypothetical protein [Thermoplasmata archaeon]
MRGVLVAVVALLLAGCTAAPSAPVVEPVESVPESIVEEQVHFEVLSPLWVCSVGCAGKSGDDFRTFGGQTYVGFRLTVQPSTDPLGVPVVPMADVRIVVECSGDHSTCPPGVLAETQGPWPAAIEASGFRIVDPDQLAFRVEYVGPYPQPVNGAGGDFEFEGTLSFVEGSEVDDAETSAEGA